VAAQPAGAGGPAHNLTTGPVVLIARARRGRCGDPCTPPRTPAASSPGRGLGAHCSFPRRAIGSVRAHPHGRTRGHGRDGPCGQPARAEDGVQHGGEPCGRDRLRSVRRGGDPHIDSVKSTIRAYYNATAGSRTRTARATSTRSSRSRTASCSRCRTRLPPTRRSSSTSTTRCCGTTTSRTRPPTSTSTPSSTRRGSPSTSS
jgi:hypothetical protein